MEIRDLMYLEASAAAGNFTRAAKSLGINTATISRRLGRFEDELDLALFERSHAGIRLTSGGKAILPHIRRALAELDAIRHSGDRNGHGIVGEVRLRVRRERCKPEQHVRHAAMAGKEEGAQGPDGAAIADRMDDGGMVSSPRRSRSDRLGRRWRSSAAARNTARRESSAACGS